jgi:hypothetical protein
VLRLGAVATVGKMNRQEICPVRKILWSDGCLGAMGSLWLKACETVVEREGVRKDS